jgi:hypothetical protein
MSWRGVFQNRYASQSDPRDEAANTTGRTRWPGWCRCFDRGEKIALCAKEPRFAGNVSPPATGQYYSITDVFFLLRPIPPAYPTRYIEIKLFYFQSIRASAMVKLSKK